MDWSSYDVSAAVRGYLAAQDDDKAGRRGAQRDVSEGPVFTDAYDLWFSEGRYAREQRACH